MSSQDPPDIPDYEEPSVVGDEAALTHSFTNYLNALYQGQFAYLNILKIEGHPDFSEKEFSETQAILENTGNWRKRLFDGDYVFPKKDPDKKVVIPDEAKRIMSLLEALRPKQYSLAQKLETVLSDPDLDSKQPHMALLTASFARYTYTRENYLNGGLEFADHFGIDSVIDEAQFYLQLAQQDIQLTHSFMEALREFDVTAKEFIKVIIGECRILPGALRIFNNDIVALLNSYEEGIDFDTMGIPPNEVTAWRSSAVPPQVAADWRAHRLEPNAAIPWMAINSPYAHGPTIAASWHFEGFTPENFLEWADKGIRPYIARAWKTAGYNSEQSNDLINQGYLLPHLVPKDPAAPPAAPGGKPPGGDSGGGEGGQS